MIQSQNQQQHDYTQRVSLSMELRAFPPRVRWLSRDSLDYTERIRSDPIRSTQIGRFPEGDFAQETN